MEHIAESMSTKRLIARLRDGARLLRDLRSNPQIGEQLKRSALFRRVSSVVPPKFLRHYVYPRIVGRGAEPYDAARFFESFYLASGKGVSDAATLSPTDDPLTSRYHYAVTEKALIECLVRHGAPRHVTLLDVGAGAGHWVDFYRAILAPSRIVALDIARPSIEALGRRMAHAPEVAVRFGDVTQPGFELGERFRLISAIGVMFHIIDDEAWERGLQNLARHLEPRGRLVVGGQFGWVTANVQLHGSDDFSSWADAATRGPRLVNKRIRSLRRWRRAATAAGLRVVAVHRTREVNAIYTPENNILLLEKRG
jgi:SAM-dependent methyltransferase